MQGELPTSGFNDEDYQMLLSSKVTLAPTRIAVFAIWKGGNKLSTHSKKLQTHNLLSVQIYLNHILGLRTEIIKNKHRIWEEATDSPMLTSFPTKATNCMRCYPHTWWSNVVNMLRRNDILDRHQQRLNSQAKTIECASQVYCACNQTLISN